MLKDLVELVRAPAALTVPGDVLAGAVAAGNLRSPVRLAGLAASSVAIYWAGMALNDWADRELDAVERPERPIPSGRVTPRTAFTLAASLTAAGLALSAIAGGRPAFRTSALLAATAWTYDLAAKNTPAAPFVMAATRSLDVLVGAAPTYRAALAPALAIGTHILTTTHLSHGEVHGTTPTPARLALTTTTLITTTTTTNALTTAFRRPGPGVANHGASSATAHLAGAALATPRLSGAGGGIVAAALAGLYMRAVAPSQAAAASDPSAGNVRKAVGAGIHGLVPLQAAWCARGGAPGIGLALVTAFPLAKALARKVSPT